MAVSGSDSPDHYEVLGVASSSTSREIQVAYRKLSLRYHPDKCQDDESHELFTNCNKAYTALRHPINRKLYDIAMGFVERSEKGLLEIQTLEREEAQQKVSLMDEEVSRNVKFEQNRQGLVVLKAMYGILKIPQHLSANKREFLTRENFVIDVTKPMQCLVDESRLEIEPGLSKSELDGFYDPYPLEDDIRRHLSVQYSFLGGLHKTIVADTEELRIPQQSHAVVNENSDLARAMKRASRASKRRQLQQKSSLTVKKSLVFLSMAGIAAFATWTEHSSFPRFTAICGSYLSKWLLVGTTNEKPTTTSTV